ncbi:hypothetical protein F4808DRAFT_61235 [Astrocystis sublimbata]|nr:hypothetical protein F4808DRAFT_61235 [Astrocystis sublimbata]
MAVTTDGKRQQPLANGSSHKASKVPNGVNGVNGINGVNGVKGANAQAVSVPLKKRASSKKQKGFFAWSFSVAARLFTWYCIISILFRCPASLDACDETSPKICKPYFQAREAVAPHVTPYYDAYAAPYVDLARPYYVKLDRTIITPGRTYAVKYGAPRVVQAQAYGRAQWAKSVQPQVLKYQALAKTQYDQTISPYVDKAAVNVAPYYDIARTNALQTYHEILVPAYTFVQPYALQGYDAAYGVTKDTVIPSTVWAWTRTYAFLDAAVWPHVRDVYVLKVEPQLVRIGERLGRYNEKISKPVAEEPEPVASKISSFVKPTSSASSTVSSSMEQSTQSASQVADPEPSTKSEEQPEMEVKSNEAPKSKEEIREHAAKEVADDLAQWEGKFTQVAEEGATEIEDRIDEISTRMIDNHANSMGVSLVKQLNSTVHTELESLKSAILDILQSSKSDSKAIDEKVAAAVRDAGLKIKDKAQNIRDWRRSYEQGTEMAVTKAAQEHFSILEQTRDLAIQRIGMKWAWMDGVTYKHWQQYHQLRARFDEWIDDLKRLITTHPGLVAAQTAGTNVEDEGMAIAHEAAADLGKLKQVASWKAFAEDYTDDFDSNRMQLAAEAVEKRIAEAAESARSAAEAVVDGVKSGVGAAEESASETISSVAADAEEAETVVVSLAEAAESAIDEPSTSAAQPIEDLPSSEPIDGPEQIEETILESGDFPIHSVDEDATATPVKSAMFGAAAESVPTRKPVLDEEVYSSASSVVSVAQSDVPASITSAAQSAYTAAIAEAANQYSRAMSVVSVQVSGEPKPAHEEMFSSVSSGYFGALAAANSRLNEAMTAASQNVYGTPTIQWIPGMPTVPSLDWERVQSIAQLKYQESVDWASDQYESAKVAIGAAEPTPSTYLEGAEKQAEKLLDQARHNYYAGVGIAHARYTEFLSAASTAVSSLTATPTPTNLQGSASSVASDLQGSASSAASVAGEAAESVAYSASASASSAVSAAGEAVGSVASSAGDLAGNAKDSIEESWEALVSRVSSQVYGAPTPTPWYENLYAAAGDRASQAGDLAASATEAVAHQISDAAAIADVYAASANAAASSQYAAMSSLVSELVVGKEPSYTESVYARLSSAYATGLASVSSLGSVASATAASAASVMSDAASSGVDAAGESIAAATDKVKEAVDHIKDEL